jgi:hypothetical protein
MSSQIAAKLPTVSGKACGAGHQPPVEVVRAVSPAADVHTTDLGHRADGRLRADEERPELGGKLRRQVVDVVVRTRLEQDDDRETRGPTECGEQPPPVRPDHVLERALTAPAIGFVDAEPGPLLQRRRQQRADAQVALERERIPVLHRRHRQPAVRVGGRQRTRVQLLRGLGHASQSDTLLAPVRTGLPGRHDRRTVRAMDPQRPVIPAPQNAVGAVLVSIVAVLVAGLVFDSSRAVLVVALTSLVVTTLLHRRWLRRWFNPAVEAARRAGEERPYVRYAWGRAAGRVDAPGAREA